MKRFAFLVAICASACSIASPTQNLLLGDGEMTRAEVAKAASGLGVLSAKPMVGFYNLALAPGKDLAAAKRLLRKRGIEYVFESQSQRADHGSLPSVRNHIKYLEASAELTGFDETKGESGHDFYEALEHYLSVRVGPNGRLDYDEMARAIQQRDAMPQTGAGGSHVPYTSWVYAGPKNLNIPYATYNGTPPLSGRKNDIAVAKTDSNTIYTASAGGGIWKTTNGGVTWAAKSDTWGYLQTSCVAVSPTNKNLVLAGTGDYRGFFGAQTLGIMRSTDGGTSWTPVGTPAMKSEVVTKIVFNPFDSNQIVCGTANSTKRTGGALYKSFDGGVTWSEKQLLNGNCDDIEVGSTGLLYAINVKTDGSSTGLIGLSVDFGNTWGITASNPCVNNQSGLDLATSPLSPNTVYLSAPGDQKIYKSVNAGNTWTDITGNFPLTDTGLGAAYNWAQTPYNLWLKCSSVGAQDLLMSGTITVAQSLGGSLTWLDVGRSYAQTTPNFVHNDQHCCAIDPNNPSIMYFGCDGGIVKYTYSPSPTAGSFTALNKTIYDTQLYHVSLHPTDLNYLGSGAQDNACPAPRGDLLNWSNLAGGDGGWTGFDQVNLGTHFAEWQYCGLFLYGGPPSFTGAYIGPPDSNNAATWPGAFITPVIFGGNGSQIFLGAKDIRLWQSGTTWSSIVPNVTTGVVTMLQTSPNDKKCMYAGTSDGKIWRSLNAALGTSWSEIDGGAFNRSVGGIAVQPGTAAANKNQVLVGLQGTGPNHLWQCTDTSVASPVWVNVSGNLPDTPINAVAYDPYQAGRWYVGTDIGGFMTVNSGASWTSMTNLGIPNVAIRAFAVSSNKAWIYAATFGRGIWKLQIAQVANAFSISGTVRTAANTPLPGATVTLKKWREYERTFSNSTGQDIPDNDANGITSTIPVTLNYAIQAGTLYLNITHTYRGDLEITLVGPDGEEWLVKAADNNDTAENVIGYFDMGTFMRGQIASGTWTLKVKDLSPVDTGRLNSWKILPRIMTFVTEATTTSDGAGAYSFTGLEGSKYYLLPTMTGKTWTPASRTVTLGPSKTAQDFTANQ